MANPKHRRNFRIDLITPQQKLAHQAFQSHDFMILSGVAGSGKSHVAMAMAIEEVLSGRREKIILTRPIVEAGEKLGFLPGDFNEKVGPYMVPLFDVMQSMLGSEGDQRETINKAIEVVPIAYMRGRTFNDAVCIFDECQNATLPQMKLFLTRLGKNSKMILTGDPEQSDLPGGVALLELIERLSPVKEVAIVQLGADSIVRNPAIKKILEHL